MSGEKDQNPKGVITRDEGLGLQVYSNGTTRDDVTLYSSNSDGNKVSAIFVTDNNRHTEVRRGYDILGTPYLAQLDERSQTKVSFNEKGEGVVTEKDDVYQPGAPMGSSLATVTREYTLTRQQVAPLRSQVEASAVDGYTPSELGKIGHEAKALRDLAPVDDHFKFTTPDGAVSYETTPEGAMRITHNQHSGVELSGSIMNPVYDTELKDSVVVTDPTKVAEIKAGLVKRLDDHKYTTKEQAEMVAMEPTNIPLETSTFTTRTLVPVSESPDKVRYQQQGFELKPDGSLVVSKGNENAVVLDEALRDKIMKAGYSLTASGTHGSRKEWTQAVSQVVHSDKPVARADDLSPH